LYKYSSLEKKMVLLSLRCWS